MNLWDELYHSENPINFQVFLESDLLAEYRKFIKLTTINTHISGCLSLIALLAIIYHILRSHKGLSTTYHRLIFGLCIANLMSSVAFVLSETLVPKELSYIKPSAQGNMAPCSTQGFLITITGIWGGVTYHCSICLYYLAIIGYN